MAPDVGKVLTGCDGNEPLPPHPLLLLTRAELRLTRTLAAACPSQGHFPELSFFCLTAESLYFIHASIYVLIWSSSPPCPNLKGNQDIAGFFSAIMLEFINRKAVCETHEVNLPFPITKASAGALHPSLGTVHQ